jgi:hypothetical protein
MIAIFTCQNLCLFKLNKSLAATLNFVMLWIYLAFLITILMNFLKRIEGGNHQLLLFLEQLGYIPLNFRAKL